jgi:hypothetical protein
MMFPKFQYVRSKKLMEAYRMIPCQHCGIDDGTVCGAHANSSKFGKGRGIKASDIYCASLCHTDHMELDQGSKMTKAEREQMWQAAHEKTVNKLMELGLWPEEIPNPLELNSTKV